MDFKSRLLWWKESHFIWLVFFGTFLDLISNQNEDTNLRQTKTMEIYDKNGLKSYFTWRYWGIERDYFYISLGYLNREIFSFDLFLQQLKNQLMSFKNWNSLI